MNAPNSEFFAAPRLYREVAIISSSSTLAATASSVLGEQGEYTCVIRSPREWPVLTHVWDLDLIIICNSIAKIRPRMLLLLQVSEKSSRALRAKLAPIPVASANTVDEALSAIQGTMRASLSGVLRCNSKDLAPGLLLAKRRSQILFVDETAPSILAASSAGTTADHLVVLDDNVGISPVIAANYAFSINADICLLPPRDDDLQREVYSQIDSRITFRGCERGKRAADVLGHIEEGLRPHLSFSSRRFVTFFCSGFPYGYFWQDSPCEV
jgi:hypothetical protein